MATWLSEYKKLKDDMEKQLSAGKQNARRRLRHLHGSCRIAVSGLPALPPWIKTSTARTYQALSIRFYRFGCNCVIPTSISADRKDSL